MPSSSFRIVIFVVLASLIANACTDDPTRLGSVDSGADAGSDVLAPPSDEADAGTLDDAFPGESDALHDADPATGEPGQVIATLSATSDAIQISWTPVPQAQGYEVIRDGSTTFAVDAGQLEYIDTDAGAPGKWGALNGLSATSDRPDGVRLTWSVEPPTPGTLHSYTVRALLPEGPGPESENVEGQRLPREVLFDIRANAEEWREIGSQSEFLDTDAPYGTFESGRARASKGAYTDRVQLSIIDLNRTPGAERTYEIRVRDGHHPEEISSSVVGRRGPADPLVQWERSSGAEPSNFIPVQGATSAPMGDMTAPQDGTIRYWRARLRYPDGAEQISEPDFGYRAVRCAVDTNFFGQLGGPAERDGGVPTTAALTHDANLMAIWNATVPAPNWAEPQELAPSIAINGATVTAVTHRVNAQFYVEDASTGMQVYLDAPLEVPLKVGQRVSFRATHVALFNGNPQVRALTEFTVLSEDNPVPYVHVTGEDIEMDAHYYRIVRLGGELGPTSSPCGDGHTCYELFYGPTGGRKSVPFRSASQTLTTGQCVTYIGPVIGYLGPMSTLPDDPTPQLETASFNWHRAHQP